MSSFLRKKSKELKERDKYSFLSVEDLEKMKSRCLVLSTELRSINIAKNPEEYKVRLKEYISIIKDLRMYKKYAKK